jgi:uncharacterized protein (TIGR03437 family)
MERSLPKPDRFAMRQKQSPNRILETLKHIQLVRFAGLFTAGILGAQPYINARGVVNTASFTAPDLPGGAIAQGSVFTILGSGLGPAKPLQATSLPLGISLAGVSVRVFQGTQVVSALPIYVSSSQIHAVMPSNAPLGRVSVRVSDQGGLSNPAPFTVVNSSFGIFSWNALDLSLPNSNAIFKANSFGSGPAFAHNEDFNTGGARNSTAQPATPEQAVTLWGVGLGPNIGSDSILPYPADLPVQVEVFVGGVPATVTASRRSRHPGVDNITFLVPDGAPLGCYVPVQVRTAGAIVSNTVTISISADGSACADSFNPLESYVLNGGAIGEVFAVRTSTRIDIGVGVDSPFNFSNDNVFALLRSEPGGPWAFNPLVSLPPLGSCAVYNTTLNQPTSSSVLGLTEPGGSLNAGSQLSILSTTGLIPAAPLRDDPRFYTAAIVSAGSGYNISAPGGADVGAFIASVALPAAPQWTNSAQIDAIQRSAGVTVTWETDDIADPIVIAGASSDVPTNSSALFLCLASPGDGQFTVPDYVLSSLPATRPQRALNVGILYVGALPLQNATSFVASGLDAGFALPVSGSAKSVSYQ